MEENEEIHLFEMLEREGFILNSESLNEWVYQKENFQITLNKLD